MPNLLVKIKKLPTSPGVYIFKDESQKIIYVGKAASLKDRVKSYFGKQNDYARPIDFAHDQIVDLETKQTDSVLEAYFLEQELIKRFQPKYNVLGKDDKSFIYVCLTLDDFPRFEVRRKTDLEGLDDAIKINKKVKDIKLGIKYQRAYGPYTSRYLIEQALRILRKIFPYHSKPQKTEKGCLDFHLGFCPGPYAGMISKTDYRKNIHAIEMILKGKKKDLVKRISKEMETYSKNEEYEKAAQSRNLLFTLRHIQDVALITKGEENFQSNFNNKISKFQNIRIEGYDISNISGRYAVGSMVVFDNEDGKLKPNKAQYRKFKIKTVHKPNDVAAMEEVLRRRFLNEWARPDLILVDGGKGHLNMAKRVLRGYHYDVPILAVAKGPTRKKLDKYYYGAVPQISEAILTQIRDEAHRFAIFYHRKLRRQALVGRKVFRK